MSSQNLYDCPCCGKPLAFIGTQTYPAKYNRPPRVLVECTNAECQLYGSTCTHNDLTTAWQAIQQQTIDESPLAPGGRGDLGERGQDDS